MLGGNKGPCANVAFQLLLSLSLLCTPSTAQQNFCAASVSSSVTTAQTLSTLQLNISSVSTQANSVQASLASSQSQLASAITELGTIAVRPRSEYENSTVEHLGSRF